MRQAMPHPMTYTERGVWENCVGELRKIGAITTKQELSLLAESGYFDTVAPVQEPVAAAPEAAFDLRSYSFDEQGFKTEKWVLRRARTREELAEAYRTVVGEFYDVPLITDDFSHTICVQNKIAHLMIEKRNPA
jgi:hypothetical protein